MTSSAVGFMVDADTIAAVSAAIAQRDKAIQYTLQLWTNNTLPVAAASTTVRTLGVAGNHTARFAKGMAFRVEDSTGNDGTYTCTQDAAYDGTNTVIYVLSVPSAVADGTIHDEPNAVAFTGRFGWQGDDPATLSGELVHGGQTDYDEELARAFMAIANERSGDNRARLACNARLTAYVSALSEVKLDGRLFANRPGPGARYTFSAQDWGCLLNECEGASNREPDSIEVVAIGATRRVHLLDMDGDGVGDDPDGVYSFVADGSGTDPAFDEATQSVRRSLKPTGLKLHRKADISDPSDAGEVPPEGNYTCDWPNGGLQILEANALTITAADTGADTVKVAGNHAHRFRTGFEFSIIGGPNAGDYVCAADATYASGETTIFAGTLPSGTVAGVVSSIYYATNVRAYLESAATGAANCDWARVAEDLLNRSAAAEYGGIGAAVSLPDLGLDLPGAFVFPSEPGKPALVADGVKEMQKALGGDYKIWYESESQAWRHGFARQAIADEEDWSLHHASSVEQARELAQLATRIVETGYHAMPVNALANPARAGISEAGWTDLTGGGTWQHFNGSDPAEPAGGFGQVIPLIHDGDHAMGPLITDLPGGLFYPEEDPDQCWAPIATRDFGGEHWIQRLRVRMLGSRNPNSGSHQGKFWPGVQVEASADNVDFFDVAPELSRINYPPGHLIDLKGSQLRHPRARYLRLTCCCFKFGERGESAGVRGCGVAEVEVYLQERYRHVRAAQDSDPTHFWPYSSSLRLVMTDADTAGWFKVAGDFTGRFTAGVSFGIAGSASAVHDGVWTVASSSFGGGKTTINVVEAVASSVASGRLVHPVQSSYYRDLLARFGGRHRTLPPVDNGESLPSSLAADKATQRFGEAIRLFRRFSYTLPDDPRLRRYQTTTAPDPWNGGARSIILDSYGIDISSLPNDGSFSPPRASCSGVNYREDPLEATS